MPCTNLCDQNKNKSLKAGLALALATTLLTSCANQAKVQQPPPRLTRAESFFGIHFDFHAGMDCTNIGAHHTADG